VSPVQVAHFCANNDTRAQRRSGAIGINRCACRAYAASVGGMTGSKSNGMNTRVLSASRLLERRNLPRSIRVDAIMADVWGNAVLANRSVHGICVEGQVSKLQSASSTEL
jgi:hypothetical protein